MRHPARFGGSGALTPAAGCASGEGTSSDGSAKQQRPDWLRRYWPRLLFLIPLIAMLWVPFYNRFEPTLGGVPFFYWYQLAWILLGAGVVLAGLSHRDAKIAHAPSSPSGDPERTDVPGDIL